MSDYINKYLDMMCELKGINKIDEGLHKLKESLADSDGSLSSCLEEFIIVEQSIKESHKETKDADHNNK